MNAKKANTVYHNFKVRTSATILIFLSLGGLLMFWGFFLTTITIPLSSHTSASISLHQHDWLQLSRFHLNGNGRNLLIFHIVQMESLPKDVTEIA